MSWVSAAWTWYSGGVTANGTTSFPHAGLVNPVIAGLGAMFLIGAAIQQARIATRRHVAQTAADQQRRITESFARATEQLGSDKVEVRLGGIYTLERLSRESRDDYWNVMETLTAYAREHARWIEPEIIGSETVAAFYQATAPDKKEPSTDVAAVLSVIRRRSDANRKMELDQKLRLDLRRVDLRGADLIQTQLENAYLQRAHFEGAILQGAHLSGAEIQYGRFEEANLLEADFRMAYVHYAHFENAVLIKTLLSRAWITEAYFQGAKFWMTDLSGSYLNGSRFDGADLNDTNVTGAAFSGAHLEGADLTQVKGLVTAQLEEAHGDAATRLPWGVARPAHWPPADGSAGPGNDQDTKR